MREILFRGKRIDTKEWVEGSYIYAHKWNWDGSAGHLICDIYGVNKTQVISETIGQFTGLTDKNGKRIFEGDIVAYNELHIDGKEYQEIGYFECCENFVSFRIHGKQITPFYCEVIGNIHDNKELLGEEQ